MKKGLVKVMFKMESSQLEVLRSEATRRMAERKAGRIDTSEVVREAVAAWINRRK
jgi:cob(I)alamin adenosyltransferase